MSTWKTHDGRVVPYADLGDQHLVNILKKMELNRAGKDTPTPRFTYQAMQQYGDLVIEAIRRGLFEWSADRKYLTPIMDSIKVRTTTTLPINRLRSGRYPE